MKEKIIEQIKIALGNLGIEAESILLEHPADMKMGDYSTNVAMMYAKKLTINPRELAEKIKTELENKIPEIEQIEVAGAGFINFYLNKSFFQNSTKEILDKKEAWGRNEILNGKKIMVEYTDPNPFKPFHIGHLMTNAIGESISRIIAFCGADVICANYQGDVGPHVAKAIYGLLKVGLPEENLSVTQKAQYIGRCYSDASTLYEESDIIKKEIDIINKKIYERSDEKINEVYDWGRSITLDAFEELYKILGTKFKYYFFESVMAPIGLEIVKNNPTIYEESNGAIVFHGEKYDPKLHTRVFINSAGLPTYETKELGLTKTKFEKENLDLSIVVTATEQTDYMRVVEKSISLIYPDTASKMKHITHGMMRFASGKMSSRKGNVVTGESLIRDSIEIVEEKVKDRDFSEIEKKEIAEKVGISALKYSILKSSLGSDIVYDFEKSISFEGDSGPYLQYTAVRAKSILKKAVDQGFDSLENNNLENKEITNLEKLLYRFPEVVSHSYENLEPHHIANFLTELASSFNSFYGNTIILNKDDFQTPYRLKLVSAFYQTMKNGLNLLGIETPDKM